MRCFFKQQCRHARQVHFSVTFCMRTNLCDSSQNHNTVCMSALAATLHTLHQCSCIRPSTYATVHLSVSLPTLQQYNTFHTSITSKPQTACGCRQRGAATLSRVQVNLIIAHHILRKITTSRRCPYHLACHALFTLHTIWTGESNAYGHFHIAYKFPLPHAMKFHLLNNAKIFLFT